MIVKQGTNRYFCFTRKVDFILELVMCTSLSFCEATRIWNVVFIEGFEIYCLLCKKHNTKNNRNKSTVFSEVPSTHYKFQYEVNFPTFQILVASQNDSDFSDNQVWSNFSFKCDCLFFSALENPVQFRLIQNK
jgi:hypothetical protein